MTARGATQVFANVLGRTYAQSSAARRVEPPRTVLLGAAIGYDPRGLHDNRVMLER